MIAGIILAGLAILAAGATFVLMGLLHRAVAHNASLRAGGAQPPKSRQL